MKIWIFSLRKQPLCNVFVEFILLMGRIKHWYNTHLQVLTNAPALHSLIILERNDAARILEFRFRNRGYLRKLILKRCSLGEDSTGLLANIVALYPDLESLSLVRCHPLTSTGCCLIPRLKKLSELNLSFCQVHYLYFKMLERRVCIG
jgi:hypothetical protein